MVDGERNLCCTYLRQRLRLELGHPRLPGRLEPEPVVGHAADRRADRSGARSKAAPDWSSCSALVDKRVERLRQLGDDCPLDAGGRDRLLAHECHAGRQPEVSSRASCTRTAWRSTRRATCRVLPCRAIGLHRDVGRRRDPRSARHGDADSTVRRAGGIVARRRIAGAHGFETLRRLIGPETLAGHPTAARERARPDASASDRRRAAGARAQRRRTRSVRAEADLLAAGARRPARRDDVMAVIEADTNDTVKHARGRRPGAALQGRSCAAR